MDDNKKKYPEGHFIGMWIGIGMAMFAGIGVAMSVALDNYGLMGIGPALGVGFGVAIGASIEAQKKKEGLIRELTDEEKARRKSAKKIGIILLGVGFIALIALFFIFKLK